MSDSWRRRAGERYQRLKKRDEDFLLRINLPWVQTMLWLLFGVLLVLEFIDVLSTLAALSFPEVFRELNPIAAALFNLRFSGFLVAIAFKYAPLVPIAYGVFLREKSGKSVQVRTVKVGTLVVLIGANMIYITVAASNVATLAKLFA